MTTRREPTWSVRQLVWVGWAFGLGLVPAPGSAQAPPLGDAAPIDAVAAVASEIRGFYRDREARDWSALLSHFWPAKVTARWSPDWNEPLPAADAQAGHVRPVADPHGSTGASGSRSSTLWQVRERWARVRGERCDLRGNSCDAVNDAAVVDEFGLIQMDGKWKIVRLRLGAER